MVGQLPAGLAREIRSLLVRVADETVIGQVLATAQAYLRDEIVSAARPAQWGGGNALVISGSRPIVIVCRDDVPVVVIPDLRGCSRAQEIRFDQKRRCGLEVAAAAFEWAEEDD
jgi:hypothetical protein